MKAKEPTATYYTPSMVDALQRSILNRVSQERNRRYLRPLAGYWMALPPRKVCKRAMKRRKHLPMRISTRNMPSRWRRGTS